MCIRDSIDGILNTTVEQCYSDFFSRYLYERGKYFDIERRSLETILLDSTQVFNINHDKEIRSRSLLNKFNKNLESYGITELNGQASTNRSRLSQFNTFLKTHLDRDHLSLSRSNTLGLSLIHI